MAWNTLGGEVRASRLGQEGVVLDPGGFLVGPSNTLTQLSALGREVRAQSGKKLSVSVADTLLAALTGLLGP